MNSALYLFSVHCAQTQLFIWAFHLFCYILVRPIFLALVTGHLASKVMSSRPASHLAVETPVCRYHSSHLPSL